MAGEDFAQSLDTHVGWGIGVLDLKDCVLGKGIADLTDDEASRAAAMIRERGLSVHCLSSIIFHPSVEKGEAHFREHELGRVDRLVRIAEVLQPRVVRLLAPQTDRRGAVTDSVSYLKTEHPWVFDVFRQAIDEIDAAGFRTTIENECGSCIFSAPSEVLGFFNELQRPDSVGFTWDVQNFWQMGTFPSLEVYRQLRPLIDYYHVKGGRHDGTSPDLRWRSTLEDASWPVLEITREVVSDGCSPVICLNPPHGEAEEGRDISNLTKRDIDFLRREIQEIAG